MIMCHMIADSLPELHDMAIQIWGHTNFFQNESRYPHYDICKAKKEQAIKLGAIEITDQREFIRLCRKLKTNSEVYI